MRIVKNRSLAILVFFLFVFVGAAFFYTKKAVPAFSPEEELIHITNSTATPLEVFRKNLTNILSRGGIDGAFDLIALAFNRGVVNIDECHTILHLVGHYAYARSDGNLAKLARTDGSLCVSSFIHGVEAEIALQSTGNTIEQLKNYCAELKESIPGFWCYHGAGHAFLESRMDIPWALKQCNALAGDPESDLSNCYRGIFSEYGSNALGYDGDTGLSLSGGPSVKVDFEKPLLFCNVLEESYRSACYSQLTKIHASRGSGLTGCLIPEYTREAQKVCVQIIMGVSFRSQLDNREVIKPEPFILTLASDFRQKYIDGALDGFLAHSQSGKKKDWKAFCTAFPQEDDRTYCLKFNP